MADFTTLQPPSEKAGRVTRARAYPPIEDVIHAQGEAEGAPLTKSSAEFVAGFVPPDYLVNGLLQRRFIYSLTAMTGAGKTALTLLLCRHIADGMPFGGRETERGRVVFFSGENPDDVRMRWIAMADHMGFDLRTIDVHFIPGVFSIENLAPRIHQEVEQLGGAALVVVDTSAAYFEGDDENNNVQLGGYGRMMREKLTKLPGGPCVIVNCHPAKGASSDNLLPRGGGAFLNEMDGNLVCKKGEGTVSVHWQGKFRGPDFEPFPFETMTVTTPRLRDSKGRLISTVIARLLTADEQRQQGAEARSAEDDVLILLMEAGALSVAATATGLGWLSATDGEPQKSKAHRVLKKLKDDKLVTSERDGWSLTAKGKDAAKKVKYNRDAAGATYA
jgi:hypothetical protein